MQLIKGKEKQPVRATLYGVPGVGKSTFASESPDAVFIQTEDGLGEIDCVKLPLVTSYQQFLEQLGWLCQQTEHEFKTAVVDTLDWLEKLIHANVCKRKNVKSLADIGYGKGPDFAMEEWKEVIEGLNYLWQERGLNIILLAHAKIEKFNDPETASYDRYTLDIHKEPAAYVSEWSTAVLFATHKRRTETVGQGFRERTIAKPIGAEGGERVLRTVQSPTCLAKNRYGIVGEIPLSWDAFAAHLN